MKVIKIILIILVLFTICPFCYAEDINPIITSNAAIVMEMSTKRVLFGKNERKRVKIASTTKILTAIIAVENSKLTDVVIISKKVATTGGSTVGLKEGSKVTIEALLYGLLLKSGNDCAVAIAEYIGGDISTFAYMMNEKAKAIGAKDTNCTNPHGLDMEDNYSTAYDIALITCYAKSNEIISKILGTQKIEVMFGNVAKFLANTNRLLFTYPYCDGGKTGFTNIANRCLVATAKKDELQIVAVVLGAQTTDIRFKEGKELLKYGIDNYKMTNISEYVHWYIDIPVYKGRIPSYIKKFGTDIILPLKSDELEKIYVSQNILPLITAPASIGTKLGNIQLYIKNELLYTKDIFLEQDIQKNTVLDYILKGIKGIFKLSLDW